MNKKTNFRQSLILGALLHDIGKLVQRAEDNSTRPMYKHTHWGTEWYQKKEGLAEKLTQIFDENEKQIIRSAINNHHHGEKYVWLADAISAGMDRIDLESEEKGDPYADRLISIFSRVSISNKPKEEMYHLFAWLGKDDLQETFPTKDKKCTQKEYTELLGAFNSEIRSLDFTDLTASQIIEQVYFLL